MKKSDKTALKPDKTPASGVNIALVLGAGSARGFAHIGVLQVLEENAMQPDLIVGCSMGALIGAIYAAGTDISRLGQLVCHLEYRRLFDWQLPGLGLMHGKKLEELITLLTRGKSFADLTDPRFLAVATDLVSRRLVVLREGTLTAAVRASCSVPGMLEPVRQNNMVLVDGAVCNRLPVEVARAENPKILIAVDVKASTRESIHVHNALDVILNSLDIMESQPLAPQGAKADVLILPDVHHIFPANFKKAEELILEGRKATEKALPKLLRLAKQKLPGS
jgi:NTE family protein